MQIQLFLSERSSVWVMGGHPPHPQHSQLMEQIKQTFIAGVVEEGFYQLNHSNQL